MMKNKGAKHPLNSKRHDHIWKLIVNHCRKGGGRSKRGSAEKRVGGGGRQKVGCLLRVKKQVGIGTDLSSQKILRIIDEKHVVYTYFQPFYLSKCRFLGNIRCCLRFKLLL